VLQRKRSWGRSLRLPNAARSALSWRSRRHFRAASSVPKPMTILRLPSSPTSSTQYLLLRGMTMNVFMVSPLSKGPRYLEWGLLCSIARFATAERWTSSLCGIIPPLGIKYMRVRPLRFGTGHAASCECRQTSRRPDGRTVERAQDQARGGKRTGRSVPPDRGSCAHALGHAMLAPPGGPLS
jgi:hypothetical protein